MPMQPNNSSSFSETLLSFSPWRNVNNPSYPLNRYILKRNVAGFPFAEKISKKDAESIRDKISSHLQAIYPEGQLFKSADLKENEMQLLFEHLFLANREPIHEEGAIFIDTKSNIIALLHLSDHLTLFFHDNNHGQESICNEILSIDETLQTNLPFAFSDQFGYITESATDLGCGLSAEAIIHAPALNILDEEILVDDKVIIHGLASEKNVLHDLIIVTNRYCLGISELNIINKVFEAGKMIAAREKDAQEKLKSKKEFLNTLSKDFGQALYCKTLPFHDALALASSLDLGVSLEYIESENKTLFFDLFFSLRRAHLNACNSNGDSTIEEKRANHFKEKIKDLKLVI